MSTYHIQYHVPVWVEVEVYEPVSDGDEVEVEAEVLRVVVDDGALQGGPWFYNEDFQRIDEDRDLTESVKDAIVEALDNSVWPGWEFGF